MSTDPYPEVSGDESGIVPPQSGRSSEWPKKLRTLTATELDRLTIDGNGRFYWDGRLVNYEPPQPKEPETKQADTREQSAMEMIDRAAHDLADHETPETIEGANLPQPVETHVHDAEHDRAHDNDGPAVDLDLVRPAQEAFISHEVPEAVAPVRVIRGMDVFRLRLSRWQSLGAILIVLGVLIGASGMAAYGFVAAHDWGCRTGLIQTYCPATAAPRPRSDIPA